MCATILSARKTNANQSLGGMLSPGRFCSEVCYNPTFSEHEQAQDIVDWIISKRANFATLGVGVNEETLRKHLSIHWKLRVSWPRESAFMTSRSSHPRLRCRSVRSSARMSLRSRILVFLQQKSESSQNKIYSCRI